RHQETNAAITLIMASAANPHGWGRIIRDGDCVRAIVEERDATPHQKAIREVNVGIYYLDSALLFRLLRQVRPNNQQKEIYLTDIVGLAVAEGLRVSDVEVSEAEVAQVNSRAELAAVEQFVRRRTMARLMADGVTIIDPDNTYIDADVQVGADTVIGP